MKARPEDHNLAHIWLFAADVEPSVQDASGDTRAESLAQLLADQYAAGRREAASLALRSGTFEAARDPDQTGEYKTEDLERLKEECA